MYYIIVDKVGEKIYGFNDKKQEDTMRMKLAMKSKIDFIPVGPIQEEDYLTITSSLGRSYNYPIKEFMVVC